MFPFWFASRRHRKGKEKDRAKEEEGMEKEEALKGRCLRDEVRDNRRIFVISSNQKKRQALIKMELFPISANLRKNLSRASTPKSKKKKEKEDS